MERETVIRVFMMMLESLSIPGRRISGREDIGDYDFGLRKAFGMDPFEGILQGEEIEHGTVYMLADAFSWRYFLLRLPEGEEMLLIGPYLREKIGDMALMQIMERMGVAPAQMQKMRAFYSRVAVVPSESMIISFIGKLGEALWGGASAYAVKQMSFELLGERLAEGESFAGARRESRPHSVIERSYRGEAALMYAISTGNSDQANAILDKFSLENMEQRSAVPLRNLKNYLIILNTLMRKAVEHGGVHPLYIDQLSSAVAHRIEQITALEEGYQLIRRMVRRYCLLVRNHNMSPYSPLVQSVILEIDSDLTGDLTLSAHAQRLSVNASYLSALFKKETGVTLTDFVSRRRVDYAIFLLNSTDMQVQTIAQYCGMPDVNYFTRTFRRVTGKTPTQYRRSVTGGGA